MRPGDRGLIPTAVQALSSLTGHRAMLLPGDNHGAAATVAAHVGIGTEHVHAGLLPQDKATHVRTLQDGGRRVLLVGDGVNDAPALATAHLGVAMGRHGSDLALETADAVIVRDDLTTLAALIVLSRRARRVVIANLLTAATVITVLVIWDLAGHLPLPLGVAGHEGSTVLVAPSTACACCAARPGSPESIHAQHGVSTEEPRGQLIAQSTALALDMVTRSLPARRQPVRRARRPKRT